MKIKIEKIRLKVRDSNDDDRTGMNNGRPIKRQRNTIIEVFYLFKKKKKIISIFEWIIFQFLSSIWLVFSTTARRPNN